MKVGDRVRLKPESGYNDGTAENPLDVDGIVFRNTGSELGVYVEWQNEDRIVNTYHEYDLILVGKDDSHYNNDNGSLYLFAYRYGLNAWEFDIIKRIARCRKKGQFISDLEKTKRVIDLYMKEYESKTD